jgi:hypothetical protein
MDLIYFLEKDTKKPLLVSCKDVNFQAYLFDVMESRGNPCRHFSCHSEKDTEGSDVIIFAMETESHAQRWNGEKITQEDLLSLRSE